jgi:hypothetical protein
MANLRSASPPYNPGYGEHRGSPSNGQAQDRYFDSLPNCGEMHLTIIPDRYLLAD